MGRSAKRAAAPAADPVPLAIESLDLEGHGIAHHDGKVVFVRGGLPGERVQAAIVRSKPRFDVAEVVAIDAPSCSRVVPACPHFGVCGGCATQHVEPRAQVAFKQRVLEETLRHLGRVEPEQVLPPIEGPAWGYRHRARLTVRDVAKKGGVLVGFHERGSSFVADMGECRVLPPAVSALLLPLRRLAEALSIRQRLPQVEVAIGDRDTPPRQPVALVFRVLEPPSGTDLERLREFAAEHALEVWLQPRGPDSIELLASGITPAAAVRGGSALAYTLPEFGLTIPFAPTEFTQVNAAINRQLVAHAVRLLAPDEHDRVVDLFCGLGNFTLPLATRARRVVGIEGAPALVARARENALRNQAALRAPPGPDGVEFGVDDLFAFDADAWQRLGRVDRLLIDPPRDGAVAVARVLADSGARPQRIVYVSCNPATLARDLNILVNDGGWRLRAAGVINMFPQTAHVESIVLLET
ncbi:MAG: 23S rRNA (uracil(1939)-C(5))-methyltransferase RlmD [Lautropia sp.]